ncbi:MAG: LCP family protein [Anaerolineales bacterium]|nr:LCP family protein [Anaerolineales bacterium]
MRNTKKIILTSLGILVAGLIVGGAIFYPRIHQRMQTPLGPGLEMPTYTPVSTNIVPSKATNSVTTSTPQAAISFTATPDASPTPAPLCGGPPLMFILGVGADSGQDYKYGLADAIRIARIDFTIPKVTVLSIPRDLWVEIPDLDPKRNVDHGKLNQAYFFGGEGMGYYSGPGGGPGLLARTLKLNFSVQVDHYGAVNMNTFVKIVDAVGGIDVDLEKPVDGRSDDPATVDLGFFNAGQQHLTGEAALRLSRVRKLYNDFTRQDFQTIVLCALKDKLTEPSVVIKIPKLISAFQDSVQTDLTPEQLLQLACLMPQLKRENLIMVGLPQELFEPSRVYNERQKNTTFVMDADYDVIREYIERFIAGEWPDQPDEPSCP